MFLVERGGSRKVFPFRQEVANNLGGAMTSRDHPDNTYKPIVCLGLFYSAFSTSGLSTAPISHKSRLARGLVSNNALNKQH